MVLLLSAPVVLVDEVLKLITRRRVPWAAAGLQRGVGEPAAQPCGLVRPHLTSPPTPCHHILPHLLQVPHVARGAGCSGKPPAQPAAAVAAPPQPRNQVCRRGAGPRVAACSGMQCDGRAAANGPLPLLH